MQRDRVGTSVHVAEYESWESAIRESNHGKAISGQPIRRKIRGVAYPVDLLIIMEFSKDPYCVYKSAVGIRVPFPDYRPTTQDVDSVRTWKPY